MDTSITDIINEAIRKQLPTEVGTALAARLKEADEADKRVVFLVATLKEKDDELGKLHRFWNIEGALNERASELANREKTFAKAETKLALDIAVLDATKKLQNEMVENNQKVVMAVFGNSRFKYQVSEQGNTPVAVHSGNGFSSVNSAHHSNQTTIEGEGDMPAGVPK